ncbi:MAG: DUF4139 domain-containing protein [Nitrospirae bacterium]|nr:MAG: DUF4139 domain-containing protein [Nitrospirota bacterium]
MFRQITRYAGPLAFLVLLLAGSAVHEKAWAAEATLSSGLDDQSGLSLTIYNVNLGLVKDQRTVKLPRGSSELRFMDVAAQIIPASVHIKSLLDDRSLQVIEQNYEYDLMNPQKLLDKYVGRDVRLYNKNLYTEREDIVTARLLSNNGGPIYRIGDEITFGHPGRVIFPEVPENLISKPTLVWLLENSLTVPQNIESSYLTNGINWRSDYVVTLNSTDDMIDLSGWVTIDNKSGATYKNARLKLVAGDVNRVREERDYQGTVRLAKAAAVPAAPQFKEEEFFEYHIYTLQRPSTIKDSQIKQISLITASAVPVRKELVYKGTGYYYHSRYSDPISNLKVGVFIEIWNKKDHNLGIPLPKGTVRVYKHDNEGSLQFTGEDTIDHTAKDEKIRVKLGNAFDVAGTTRQLDWKKLASDTYESGYEITLRNHKKEDIVVKIIEPVPGDWTMLSSSHPYRKSSAFSAEFEVPVPKDGESKLTYKVRTRY